MADNSKISGGDRARNALITGTAGAYLGSMVLDGKVKIPLALRRLLRTRKRTANIHGARAGGVAGAVLGATNKGKRSETVDSVATGGDWKFSAFIEDMAFKSLPKEVQAEVTRFVDAKAGTPLVHYGMTVTELIGKADAENLKSARKALGTLRASRAWEEVNGKIKAGSKYILLMNDRIVDGHHFLAKAERASLTSSLNVLDLTPARLSTGKTTEFGLLGHPGNHKKVPVLKGVPGIPAGRAAYQVPAGVRNTNKIIHKRGMPPEFQDRGKARKVGRILEGTGVMPDMMVKAAGHDSEKSVNKALRRHEIIHSIQSSKRGFKAHRKLRDLIKDEVGAYGTMNRRVKGGSKFLRGLNAVTGVPVSVGMGIMANGKLRKRAMLRGGQGLAGAAAIGVGAHLLKKPKQETQFAERSESEQQRPWRKRGYLRGVGMLAGSAVGSSVAGKAADAMKVPHVSIKNGIPRASGKRFGLRLAGGLAGMAAGMGASDKLGEKLKIKEKAPKDLRDALMEGEYTRSNMASYVKSGVLGAGAGAAVGGFLRGRRGVSKASALAGTAAALTARGAMQKRINREEDQHLNDRQRHQMGRTLKSKLKHVGLNAAVPVAAAGVIGAAIVAKRKGLVSHLANTANGRKVRAWVKKQERSRNPVRRTKVVPKGKGPILDAATGKPFPALMSARLLGLREFADPSRNRTRDLRDKLGLAKDVGTLGLIGGAGYGGHRLYKQGQKAVTELTPAVRRTLTRANVGLRQAGKIGKSWRKAAISTKETLGTVNDAVAPAATMNRGIAKAGRKLAVGAKKIGQIKLWSDGRKLTQFETAPKRDKLSQARDVAVLGGAAAAAGAAGYVVHQGRKVVKAVAPAVKEAKAVTGNVRNATRIGADMGRIYGNLTEPLRDPKRYAAKVKGGFRRGAKAAAKAPTAGWAKKVVRIGKKLRVLQVGPEGQMKLTQFAEIDPTSAYGVIDRHTGQVMHKTTYAKRQVSRKVAERLSLKYGGERYGAALLKPHHIAAKVTRAVSGVHFSEFNVIGAAIGTVAGAMLGGKVRAPIYRALLRRNPEKPLGKWAKRRARAGAYAIENGAPAVGGVVGGMIGRKAKPETQFGGSEQQADLHGGRYVDAWDTFTGKAKGYRKRDVNDYNRMRKMLKDHATGSRKFEPDTVKRIQEGMKSIEDNPLEATTGQVGRSIMRKANTVRMVAERGGGLARDVVKHVKGEKREKDAWGREKKREWEKPWFQRKRNQVIAGGAILATGLAYRKFPKLQRGVESLKAKGKDAVNKVMPDAFPDKGTAAHAAAQTGKKQSTASEIAADIKAQAESLKQRAVAAKAAAPKAPKVVKPRARKPKAQPGAGTGTLGLSAWPQQVTSFNDPLDHGWDLRDARGRSARVFAPGSQGRERRPKEWYEKIDNERKLWAGAALAGSGLTAAVMKKLGGKKLASVTNSAVQAERAKNASTLRKWNLRQKKRAAAGKGNIHLMPSPISSNPKPGAAA